MKKTLNIGGQILDLSVPKIMGIINVTPDSFFEKSQSLYSFDSKINQMLAEGVDIIDIGGYSTRPGATEISIQEEIDRVLPVLAFIKKEGVEIPISIDTFRCEVAQECLKHGKYIINDVKGVQENVEMWNLIAEHQVPYILMHSKGDSSTMQSKENTSYNNLITDLIKDLQSCLVKLTKLGVKDLIIDPGIGFSKTVEQNFEILKQLRGFHVLETPILIGLSRKSFLQKTLKVDSSETLNATTAMHSVALMNGATILRVHDVKEAVEVRNLFVSGHLL